MCAKLVERMDSRSEEVQCQILRTLSRHNCVVRLLSSGAIIEIETDDSLDITRACLITAIHPISARLVLGEWQAGAFRHSCLTHIDWPKPFGFPPPARYERFRKMNARKHVLDRSITKDEEVIETAKKRGCFLAEPSLSHEASD